MIKSSSLVAMPTYIKFLYILSLIFAPTVVAQMCTRFMMTAECEEGDRENNSARCTDYCLNTMDTLYYGTCLPFKEMEEAVGLHNIVDQNGNAMAEEAAAAAAARGGLDDDDGDYQITRHVHEDDEPEVDVFSGLTSSSQVNAVGSSHIYDEFSYPELMGDRNPYFWSQVQNSLLPEVQKLPPADICFCCIAILEL